MEKKEEKVVVEDFSSSYYYLPGSNIPIPNPISIFWGLTKLTCFKLTHFITTCVSIFILSPLFFLHSLVSESIHRAEEAKGSIESTVRVAGRVILFPASAVANKSLTVLVKKVGVGLLGAVYACVVVTLVMGLAIVLGFVLVHLWVEEPVFVREKLCFDYTDVHPTAVCSFHDGGRQDGGGFMVTSYGKKKMGRLVPVGHTFYVSLFLLLPESDFNLQIGIFQLTAELISTNGYVIAKSSQPCMLRFRSLPIRLMRTILMGIPLLLGMTDETEKITIPMLKHREGYPRTEIIRVSLIPRAGTSFVPQLYEAEIIIYSQPPWSKEIVRRWKWTFCVWTSINIYIMLLVILVCFFKPLIFPIKTAKNSSSTQRSDDQEAMTMKVCKEPRERGMEDKEVLEALRRWKQSRSERKAMLLRGVSPDTIGSSASSTSNITREETFVATTTTEDVEDSQSVTF
ncbi:hypothetical protein Vadar_025222 [Vaccinium darrowii]|uniref:Uncharacterized protein n=1 Tax=Vaccinium darrowii TaxID=229202 RepID=A0ACB7ZMU8_9ERIC|nr:hypothetical protein Vadar_025222 [Vaccinium darrowii]